MKNCVYGIQPILILVYAGNGPKWIICKHFDPSVEAGRRYYSLDKYAIQITRIYDLNAVKGHNDSKPQKNILAWVLVEEVVLGLIIIIIYQMTHTGHVMYIEVG